MKTSWSSKRSSSNDVKQSGPSKQRGLAQSICAVTFLVRLVTSPSQYQKFDQDPKRCDSKWPTWQVVEIEKEAKARKWSGCTHP